MTRLRMAGSMLPPQKGSTTRLPASSRQLARETRRQTGRAGAFDDGFFQFDDAQDGQGDLVLVDGHEPVDAVAGNGEGVRADVGHGEAVGEGGMAVDLHRASRAQSPRANFAAPSGSTPMICTSGPQRLDGQRDARRAAPRRPRG